MGFGRRRGRIQEGKAAGNSPSQTHSQVGTITVLLPREETEAQSHPGPVQGHMASRWQSQMGSPRWVPLGHTLCQLLTQEADPPGREIEWPLGQSVREQVQWTRAVGAPFWECSGLGEVPELGEVCTWKSLIPRWELGEHLGRSPEGEDVGLAGDGHVAH